MGVCEECEGVFVVEDARQKFCSPKCANRNRFRRFKKGRVHGKPTEKVKARSENAPMVLGGPD